MYFSLYSVFLTTLSLTISTPQPARAFVASYDRFFSHTAPSAKAGKLLLVELNCTACHKSGDGQMRARKGPDLAGLGTRTSGNWLRKYLENPGQSKPGTTMPHLLHGKSPDQRKETSAALGAFLIALKKPFPELKSTGTAPIANEFWRKGDPARGKQLYHTVGCVACHAPDPSLKAAPNNLSEFQKLIQQLDPEEIKELGLADKIRPVKSIPHGNLVEKYSLQALTFFLLNPQQIRPNTRMPGLKLTVSEAADIARYLLPGNPDQSVASSDSRAGLVASGEKYFEQLGCSNCHSAPGARPQPQAKSLEELSLSTNTCLSNPAESQPLYSLSKHQTDSIRLAIDEIKDGIARESSADRLEFSMLKSNCYSCHERGDQGGIGPQRQSFFETVGHVDLGDEGRLPPSLTGVGQKLNESWMKKVLSGTGDVRPHMIVRMPIFSPESVREMPSLFQKLDVTPGTDHPALERPKLVEVGRAMLDVGCVQCHPIRGERLPGVAGVDLTGTTDRIKPSWFRRFLLNPAELKKRTRMPTFFPSGKSSAPTIADGNVESQIAGMWSYLKNLDKQKLPQKIVQNRIHNFELKPTDRPIILRTFMKDVGTHAIAVGHPELVHYSWDSESVRLAQAWRGRFLDAHGTWYNRFTPLCEPLGDDIISMPPGDGLTLVSERGNLSPKTVEIIFRGYKLSPSGAPTFLYEFSTYSVADSVRAAQDGSLTRTLTVTPKSDGRENPTIGFRAHSASELIRKSEFSYANSEGLVVSVTVKEPQQFQLTRTKQDGMQHWILKLPQSKPTTIEVKYSW